MSNDNLSDNGVNEAGTVSEGLSPGRCPIVTQRGPGRHHTTARMKWTKEVNKLVIKCFYKSNQSQRGYRKRMIKIWKEIGVFDTTEQRLADQSRAIRTN